MNNKLYSTLRVLGIVPTILFSASLLHAQTSQVKGTVVDAKTKAPIPGATIKVLGTSNASSTDVKGAFQINVDDKNRILNISTVGYENKTVTLGPGETTVTVSLDEQTQQLESVVVTALGISRAQKSLTYSTQQVSGDELNKVKSTNLANNLNGKVAGVNIASSSSGPGGSAKVILRGNKSASGNNQVLYVVDGVPINNQTLASQPDNVFGGQRDGGDPISLINPEDIENISVLKGASAAALYGSQAANGVILVTTKSGKQGRTTINFSSSAQIEQAVSTPKFQSQYGQGSGGKNSNTSVFSWGDKTNGADYDNLGEFFRTGSNFTNSLTLSGGNEKNQTYFSYANTLAKGILPENDLMRHNFNLKESASFFDNKLTVEGSANYITQKLDNAPTSGFYYNPLVGTYLLPRSLNIADYKNFETFNTGRNLYDQNWFTLSDDETTQQNPWWIMNRNSTRSTRNRLLLNGSAKYKIAPWISVQARGSVDRTSEVWDRKAYAGTQHILARENGAYSYTNTTITQQYGDLTANMNFNIGDKLQITGLVGTSITDWKTEGTDFTSGKDGLKVPNQFFIQNTTTPVTSTLSANRRQLQSVFASANLAYDNWIYLDLTSRWDWSSTLAYTPQNPYAYPSVGLGIVLNDKLNLPEFVNMAKIRGSYAKVGNDLPPYTTLLTNRVDPYAVLTVNDIAFLKELKPEKTASLEIGTEWRMWNNRLNVDVTYYKTNTTNQFFKIAAGNASLNNMYAVNAGDIQNQGVEALVSLDAIRNDNFKWTTSLNFTYNKNKIVKLADGISEFTLTGEGRNNFASKLQVGGSFGDIYGQDFIRDDQGRILISEDGIPQKNNTYTKLGNSNPIWQMGWNNSFNYKNFNLSFLIDGKFDYEVMSVTQALLDGYGVSKASGDARANGGVSINGVTPSGKAVTTVDAEKWYTSTAGMGPVSSQYIYDGTVVRLRELTFGYDFNIKDSFFKKLRVNAVGRNLFYISKKAPFDPEVTMSTGNSLSGVDIFMMPATRNYGLTLNATF
ncbi:MULTISPECIES: SusC/RagA family TonB-linked outer membrane protein [Sphingobacterium]|jgi:TonB-linked SusC/RagA family outer membrane protein|uniref:SusC/RagA family TonB-linked outer membrane protein n=1 Tax=Sphingobacterium TaxID=28453 RepID=UPI00096336D9|nr:MULTISPECIES: SusC/RagA family TonB-linked outer membrane protein [Sphingobacterium]MDF2851939.1 SusC/RagA family TonB-linked outer membrane protein [Sphingobacterium multivorum]OJZ10728.1 MAG: SusC/RagA family TonB-linked outer membrane protein [Sphingobacterium sp. 40-24]HAK27742.1 SusC/RagA family TonB-linked outer membrane protein [Sphingobacterium sp.]HBI87638.1 SusC/RagA family TonB-linked outer membrane protein [Sphingobacterium sp.]